MITFFPQRVVWKSAKSNEKLVNQKHSHARSMVLQMFQRVWVGWGNFCLPTGLIDVKIPLFIHKLDQFHVLSYKFLSTLTATLAKIKINRCRKNRWQIHLKFFPQLIFQSLADSVISLHHLSTRTTDVQRGNGIHCTAENSIPIPNI